MSTTNGDVRRRPVTAKAPPTTSSNTPPKPSSANHASQRKTSFSYILLEVFRSIAGLVLLTITSSYIVTSGQSYFWGFDKPGTLPAWASITGLSRYFSGPITLSSSSLSSYDGSDPSKPIYLSLNRTIYDVSTSPHIYGPGGMYSFFSGRDASRSFVTGCFEPQVDLVPWLTGVEEIYVPLWLSKHPTQAELDDFLSSTEGAVSGRTALDLIDDVKNRLGPARVAQMQEEAYAAGRAQVHTRIQGWATMLERKGYPVVGQLTDPSLEPGADTAADLPLCKDALKNRPSMTESLTSALAAMVKDGKLDLSKMASDYAAAEGKAHPPGSGAAPGAGHVGAGAADDKARDAIKAQIAQAHASQQKAREAPSAPGHGHAGMPPHGAHNPHAAAQGQGQVPIRDGHGTPAHHHGGAEMPADHAHAHGASPHGHVHNVAPVRKRLAEEKEAQKEALKQGKVLGHDEAGGAAEAVGGVPPGGANKARAV